MIEFNRKKFLNRLIYNNNQKYPLLYILYFINKVNEKLQQIFNYNIFPIIFIVIITTS